MAELHADAAPQVIDFETFATQHAEMQEPIVRQATCPRATGGD